jgi:hypothetical protein
MMLHLVGILALLIGIVLMLPIAFTLRREYLVRVKVHAKCPGCGNHQGKLQVVLGNDAKRQGARLYIQHTCLVCQATWHEATVLKSELWFVPPAPPANP